MVTQIRCTGRRKTYSTSRLRNSTRNQDEQPRYKNKNRHVSRIAVQREHGPGQGLEIYDPRIPFSDPEIPGPAYFGSISGL